MPKFDALPCQADHGATYVVVRDGEIICRSLSNTPEDLATFEQIAAAMNKCHGDANPRLFSFLIAWNDDDPEEGEYGWSGEADDREAALAAAYEEMFASQPTVFAEDTFNLEEFREGRRVIEEWHGVNPWA